MQTQQYLEIVSSFFFWPSFCALSLIRCSADTIPLMSLQIFASTDLHYMRNIDYDSNQKNKKEAKENQEQRRRTRRDRNPNRGRNSLWLSDFSYQILCVRVRILASWTRFWLQTLRIVRSLCEETLSEWWEKLKRWWLQAELWTIVATLFARAQTVTFPNVKTSTLAPLIKDFE